MEGGILGVGVELGWNGMGEWCWKEYLDYHPLRA